MSADSQKQYFSARNGRGPNAGPLGFEPVRRLVASVLDGLRERQYFDEAFGRECVDGDSPGTLGSDPAAHFLRTILRENIWPYWQEVVIGLSAFDSYVERRWESWDEDTLFDVIEVLHDLVAKPVSGWEHDYCNCGMHYEQFDREAGRTEFRQGMNSVLRLGDPAYEMNAEGEIIEATPEEFRQLLDASVPEGTDHDKITRKMEVAIRRFKTRGVSLDDRHAAVRDLVDVIEWLRDDMKGVMLPKDESDLFQIANGFAIRHHNREQRGDYDQLTWLRWSFYVYLATIHAVLRMREKAAP